MPNWTDEQKRAIEAPDGNILLSAAAGSGKTTVLIQCVLKLMLEPKPGEAPLNLDEVLIVTFSRAGATDMRTKLSRIMDEIADGRDLHGFDPSVRRMCREQSLHLDRAMITTLHGFCNDFLKEHFEDVEIPAQYSIIDGTMEVRLRDESLDEVLEEAYTEKSEAFMGLDEGFGPKKVRGLVEALYRKLESLPEQEAWLAEMCDVEQKLETWYEVLVKEIRHNAKIAKDQFEEILNTEGCPEKLISAEQDDIEFMDSLLTAKKYADIYDILTTRKFYDLRKGKRPTSDQKELFNILKEKREAAKKLIDITITDFSPTQSRADMLALKPQLEVLAALALKVRDVFTEKKLRRATLSFNDLEHYTYRALQPSDGKESPLCEELRARYCHIFVDEYQDTSNMQESIIKSISRGNNVFMVGDIKQSIYRFRNAVPELFREKSHTYREGKGGNLLLLTRNFRSSTSVLDFVNMVFRAVMPDEETAGIAYDETQQLYAGTADCPKGAPTEIYIINKQAEDQGDETEKVDDALRDIKDQEREALLIAERIREMRAKDETLKFSDFAILTRNKSKAATPMIPVLLASGIPAYADAAEGYYETPEVQWIRGLLKLIANRRNDVELIGALHSPVTGINVEELAAIRLAYPKEMPFADAAWCCAYGVSPPDGSEVPAAKGISERVRGILVDFFDKLQAWRLRSDVVGLGNLVRLVLTESGYYAYAGSLPGGIQRQANLDQLIDEANHFEKEISGSLARFLHHMEHREKKGDAQTAHLLSENDDVVRMMTIHHSKGLEFRVVIGACLGKDFTKKPVQGELRFDNGLGFGMKYYDSALRSMRKTPVCEAINREERHQSRCEELRLLYVLLTRAKERLVLVGHVTKQDDAEKNRRPASENMGSCKSYLDLIMAAREQAKRRNGEVEDAVFYRNVADIADSTITRADNAECVEEVLANASFYADAELTEAMKWVYPHKQTLLKPLKLTASGLLRTVEGPRQLPAMAERPAFLQQRDETSVTATERGTAYHRCMQLLDLRRLRGLKGIRLAASIEEQLDDCVQRALLTEVQRASVKISHLASFFEGELGKRMLASDFVRREWSFNVLVRARETMEPEIAALYADEDIIVQGTIDCCFLENGAWILLDYKTDRTDDENELKRHYEKQLGLYALALERLTRKPVREKLLCRLRMGKNVIL